MGDDEREMRELVPVDLGSSGGRPLPVWDFAMGGDQSTPRDDGHACALLGERESALQLKCWGGNSLGQLGIPGGNRGDGPGEMGDNLPFVDFGPERRPIAVDLGQRHSCVLLDNFQVVCWGFNSSGQLGLNHNNPVNAPGEEVDLGTGRSAVAISAGTAHTCAVLNGGDLKCWGRNVSGLLGIGRSTLYSWGDGPGEMGDNMPVVNLGSGQQVVAVSAGSRHTCAVLESGDLKCWGGNTSGQLGRAGDSVGYYDSQMGDNLAPVDVGGGRSAVSVSAGVENTCALLSDGAFKCWGEGNSGKLLRGGTGNVNTPSAVADLGLGDGYYPVRYLSMGVSHACAVIGPGLVKCWGNNSRGQLGRGNTDFVGHQSSGASDQLLEIGAIDLGTGVSALQVAVGSNHSCALVRNQSGAQGVTCWGQNDLGQAGAGNSASVANIGDAASEMGQNLHFIDFGEGILQIAAGEDFTCALLESASVKCWGKNDVGQLGLGHVNTVGDAAAVGVASVAIDLPGTRTASRLSVGRNHACALLDDQSVVCWGAGSAGQLGQGNSNIGDTGTLDGVAPITGLSALSVEAGDEFSCAVEAVTELVRCWGAGADGRLGSGNVNNQNTPGAGLDLRTGADNDQARLLSVGGTHSCAGIIESGNERLVCWGGNASGQLAQGDTDSVGGDVGSPITSARAASFGPLFELYLGGDQSCVVDADFKAQCWGENSDGQLGLGNTYNYGDASFEVSRNMEKLDFGGVSGVPYTQLSFAGTVVWLDELGHAPFDGRVGLKFVGLEDSDEAYFYSDERCNGVYFERRVLSAADLNGGNYDAFYSFYPDFQVEKLSVRLERDGNFRSPCFVLETAYQTASISAGDEHTCAISPQGLLKCWGDGGEGRLGSGAVDYLGDAAGEDGANLLPVTLGGDSTLRVRKVVAGKANKTCVLTANHQLYCFGDGVGDAPGEMRTLSPIDVSTDATGDSLPVWDFDVGGVNINAKNHLCALVGENREALTLYCWGDNDDGQLGLGNRTTLSAPGDAVDFGPGRSPLRVVTGTYHTCALLNNGEVVCWGRNQAGQLGTGNNTRLTAPGAAVDFGPGRTALALEAGYFHNCALLDNFELKCWGLNDEGQLGTGDTTNLNIPGAAVNFGADSPRPLSFSGGGQYTCAILEGGELKCWGDNAFGQLGMGNTTDLLIPGNAVDLGSGRSALAVDAGFYHTCALLDDDTFKCWGEGSRGKLLNALPSGNVDAPGAAIDLSSDYYPVRSLSMGENHACAVFGPGLVKCWGDGNDGKLGQENTDSVGHATAGALDELSEIPALDLGEYYRALKVAVGANHSCAVLSYLEGAQQVVCWGKNDVGQLGVNTTSWMPSVGGAAGEMGEYLYALDFGQDVLQIDAGEDFSCALLANKNVRCWGKNDVGQLGANSTDNIGDDEPFDWDASTVAFPSGETPAFLSVGTDHACTRFESGNVLCWGGNDKGQLGISGSTDPLGDDELVSTASVINLGVGVLAERIIAGDQTTCVTTDTGEVRCWGDNASGDAGVDSLATTEYDQPQGAVDLVGTGDDTAWLLGLGDSHACISLRWTSASSRGELVCWGGNSSGQLGRGDTTPVGDGITTINSGTPLDLGGVLALGFAGQQGCAINADYQAQCWGEGSAGQLGYGNTDNLGDAAGEISETSAVLDFGAFAP